MNKFLWNIKMFLLKIRYPKAGHYERCCLVAGYSKKLIDNMVKQNIKDGVYLGRVTEKWIREETCYEDMTYWE